jgi:signal transduction histidine kinase
MRIQSRLTLQFILIVAGIMLVAELYVYFHFQNILLKEFHETLRSRAEMMAEMTVGHLPQPGDPLHPQNRDASHDPGKAGARYTENVAIYDLALQPLFNYNASSSQPFPQAELQRVRTQGEHCFMHNNYYVLGFIYEAKNGRVYLLFSEGIFNPHDLAILGRLLVGVFFIFILVVAVGGWFFAGQALAPLRSVMNQMDSLIPTHINRRLQPSPHEDEIHRLVITFNQLLDRIEQAFNTQKLFLSNISHELKNPLSVIIAQIEVILNKERPPAEYRQTLESVLEDARALNNASDRLMQLAKLTAEDPAITFHKIRIDELIWDAKARLLRLHPQYRIQVEILSLPPHEDLLLVNANEQLLKTALFNLMENSCKYSNDMAVNVCLSFSPQGSAAIDIEDNGIGIPPEDMPYVFEPFYRSAGAGRIKGSGIGLSLVKTITELHHISIQLINRPQGGLRVELRFPPPTA